MPALDLASAFVLDGLGQAYLLMVVGIGVLVAVYATGYMPHHLHAHERRGRELVRFFVLFFAFMATMTALVLATDLIWLFVAFEGTTLASYALIGFDRQSAKARRAALTAIVVTGVSAIAFLVGAIGLHAQHGTFSIDALARLRLGGPADDLALVLIVIAALAKSAQVPLHFWLPRAMAAPTPVSAYLHSAAMVAAGVFLLARLHPLLAQSFAARTVLATCGVASIVVGSALALEADGLKRILAYSTISQYGYVVVLLSGTGPTALAASTLYVLAHAPAKCGLFLCAGIVIEATGADRLSKVGGLFARMPVVGVACGLLALALAGAPLSIGYFKDEWFFVSLRERGGLWPAFGVLAAALTLAYMARFWWGLFGGKRGPKLHPLPRRMTAVVALLALLVFGGGVWPDPVAALARGATEASSQTQHLATRYHIALTPLPLMALAAYVFGTLLFLGGRSGRRVHTGGSALLVRAVALAELTGVYDATVRSARTLSRGVTRREVRELGDRLLVTLVPAWALVALAALVSYGEAHFVVGPMSWPHVPLVASATVVVVSAVVAVGPHPYVVQVLALSMVGYALAVSFALLGAPDVAMVAVLVETMFTLLFLSILALHPPAALQDTLARRPRPRDLAVAVVGAGVALVISWQALSFPEARSLVHAYVRLAPLAHGKDVVTVVLADFRGLDTMGEISVVAIALVTVMALMRGQEFRR